MSCCGLNFRPLLNYIISEPKKRQLWLKVWFSKLEIAESENGDFFEVTEEEVEEEEDTDMIHCKSNCDIPDQDTSVERSKIFPQDDASMLKINSLDMEDNLYFDPTQISSVNLCNTTTSISKTNWETYEDTHEIRQRNWSLDSFSPSSEVSVMSTTSSTSSS